MPNEQEHLDEAIWHARDYFAQCVEIYGREAYLRGDDIIPGSSRRERARYLAVRHALAVLADHTTLPNREDY